jgi:hypothetical protein
MQSPDEIISTPQLCLREDSSSPMRISQAEFSIKIEFSILSGIKYVVLNTSTKRNSIKK